MLACWCQLLLCSEKLQAVGCPAKEVNVFLRFLGILLWLLTGASSALTAMCFVIAHTNPEVVPPFGGVYGQLGVIGVMITLLALALAIAVEGGRK